MDRSTHHVTHFLKFALQFFVQTNDFLEGGMELSTLGGEPEFLLAAIYDQHVKMRFHRLKLLTDSGLSHPVKSGCLGEALGLDQVAIGL